MKSLLYLAHPGPCTCEQSLVLLDFHTAHFGSEHALLIQSHLWEEKNIFLFYYTDFQPNFIAQPRTSLLLNWQVRSLWSPWYFCCCYWKTSPIWQNFSMGKHPFEWVICHASPTAHGRGDEDTQVPCWPGGLHFARLLHLWWLSGTCWQKRFGCWMKEKQKTQFGLLI